MSFSSRVALVCLFAVGLAVRVVHLDVPPIEFHPTRQYRSALIARSESPAALAALSDAARPAAIAAGRGEGAIEPEVIEAVAIASYELLGHEDLRAPRLFSILAWLGGTAALVWLLQMAGIPRWWVFFGAAFPLLAPYSIDASRGFMPDPLMTGLIMAALALTLRHHTRPTVSWAVARLVVIAAAIYVKPMALCFIGPPVLALDITRLGWMRGLLSTGLTCLLAILPTAMYYLSLAGEGNNVAADRLFTDLWWLPSYWTGWFEMVRRVIGWPALVVSVLGLVLARGPARLLLAAAWAGYVVMGLMFTHHISTHDYYSLPLLPLAGGAMALALHALVAHPALRRVPFAPTAVAVIVALSLLPPWLAGRVYGDIDRARQTAADYEHIGAITGHSTSVMSLDGAYGKSLAYHGRLTPSQMPLSIDRVINHLTGRPDVPLTAANLAGGDFFVGTLQPELDAQPDLKTLLEQRHVLLDRGGTTEAWRYVVYDLKAVRLSGDPERLSVFSRVGQPPGAAAVVIRAPAGVAWQAASSDPARISITPDTGVGDTEVQVLAYPAQPGGEGEATITLRPGGSDTPAGQIAIEWRTLDRGPNMAPFGFVDAPADPVDWNGTAPVVFQGWALDDVDFVRVDVIVRIGDSPETTIGSAVRAGRRPDVAAAHPTAHDLERAAWHFVLTGAVLESAGVRLDAGTTATILFRALDGSGTTSVIGQRTLRLAPPPRP